MEVSWADRVKNEVWNRSEKRPLTTVKRKTANLIGHMWQRNCLLRHVIEGKIEGRRDEKTRKKT
jgi:hypothetical protein